jgi:hypothetical protein
MHGSLDAVPGVGQAFVDHVSSRSGLAPSKFLGSADHPMGDRANRLDFLIRCQDYDVLFEHKLDSPLGHRQLERYLTLCQTRGQKLALVAASSLPLEASVCGSPWFVRPREAGAPAHFLWQDVHQIVRGFPDRIARDFVEYLEALGLAHFDWAGRGDPLTSDEAARAQRSLYDALAPMFRAPGVSCLKTANSLIYQIRRPFPPVHLINVGPLVSVAEWDRRVWGRVMALWVWARRPGGGNQTSGRTRRRPPRVSHWPSGFAIQHVTSPGEPSRVGGVPHRCQGGHGHVCARARSDGTAGLKKRSFAQTTHRQRSARETQLRLWST